MTRARSLRSLRLLVALASLCAACTYPYVNVSVDPGLVAVLQGSSVSIRLRTGASSCPDDDDALPCADIEGLLVDFLAEGLPPGLTASFDVRLQSPDTPGLVELTLDAAPDVSPDLYEIAIHAVVQGAVVGTAMLRVLVQPAQTPAALRDIAAIEAGAAVSFVVAGDGSVLAFGKNDSGELGDGTRLGRNLPVPVLDLDSVVAIDASLDDVEDNTIAADDGGSVWVWGYNGDRLLGPGPRSDALRPRLVPGLSDVVDVATSASHRLAVDGAGIVHAWGENDDGQLGDGTTTSRNTPQPVPGLTDVVQVAAGNDFSLARRADGTVWSWGSDSRGRLGRAGSPATPAPIPGIADAIWIAAGHGQAFALLEDGALLGWGRNNESQLGDGTTTDREAPTPVPGLDDVVAMDTGTFHSLAVRSDGSVWGWGSNGSGQLQVGDTTDQATPAPIPGLSDIVAVAAGYTHTLALASCGQLWAFGSNDEGQLGNGGFEGTRDAEIDVVAGTGRPGACGQAALSLRVAGAGRGTIETAASDLDCTTSARQEDCVAFETILVDSGAPVTLEATAFTDSAFAGWAGDCQGADPVLTRSFDGPATCIALFDDVQPARFLLSVDADPGGHVASTPADAASGPSAIDCGPVCNAIFEEGSEPTLTATEDPGHGFVSWDGDCSGVERDTSVLMDQSRFCAADFVAFEVGLEVIGEGTVVSDGAGACGPGICTFVPGSSPLLLTANPDPGWRFVGWSGDCSGADPDLAVDVDRDQQCTATFERDPSVRFLTVVVSGPGSVQSAPLGIDGCRGTCTALFATGSVVDLTATPDPGNTVLNWFDDCPVSPPQDSTSVLMDEDRLCTVAIVDIDDPEFPVPNFEWDPGFPRAGEVIVFDGSGSYVFDPDTGSQDPDGILGFRWDFESDGVIDASGSRAAAAVVEHTFATPGLVEVRLHVTGGDSGPGGTIGEGSTTAQLNILSAEGTVHALTVTKAGTGTGTIASIPLGLVSCDESCNATGGILFDEGESFTLVATPSPGSAFTGWSGDCAGAAPQVPVTMNGPRACVATFGRTEARLDVGVVGGGRVTGNGIDCPGDCFEVVPVGTQLVLTAEAAPGSELSVWSGCDVAAGDQCTVTLDTDRAVGADFALQQFQLEVTNSGGGRVTSDPAGIDCGADCDELYLFPTIVELTAAPDPGFQFDGWGGDCTGLNPIFDVSMTAGRICTASFSAIAANFTLTVNILGGTGRVESFLPPGDIDCPGDCTETYPPFTEVYLRDAGDPGTFFGGWFSGCDEITLQNECLVILDGNRSVEAFYE